MDPERVDLVISPYAKRGFVDHTLYDTTAILAFLEARWGLAPLGARDAAASNLLNALDSGRRHCRGRWGTPPHPRISMKEKEKLGGVPPHPPAGARPCTPRGRTAPE